MPKKRFSSEQIIARLRQIEVQLAQGIRRVAHRAGQAPEGPGAGERLSASPCGRPLAREADPQGRRLGTRRAASAKLVSPERRRQAVQGIQERYGLSERHACRIISQPRGTQRYVPTVRADEDALTQAIIALASQHGRYGYRRITALLQRIG
jgi:hypothetical protein